MRSRGARSRYAAIQVVHLMKSRRTARKPSVATQPSGLLLLFLFVALVSLTGGGSRSDIESLPWLRGLAVLFAGYALATMPADALKPYRIPLLLILFLGLWMLVQQVPLPYELWSSLPGREIVVALDQQLGLQRHWRPISLVPSHSMNSFLALTVPLAALLVAVSVPLRQRQLLWWAIWCFGLSTAAFSMLQLVGGAGSPAYLYRITNGDSLVGLFSNRNHNAFLLALAIIAAGWLAHLELLSPKRRNMVLLACWGSIAAFLMIILAIGSRQGFLTGLLGLITAYGLFLRAYQKRPPKRPRQTTKALPVKNEPVTSAGRRRFFTFGIPMLAVGLLVILFYLSDRSNSISRLAGERGADEIRLQALPKILELVQTHWLFGSGFGSFPRVFQVVEPDGMLSPTYLNHAHNDWLQLPIEGGLPAVAVLVCMLIWLAAKFFRPGVAPASPVASQSLERFAIGAAFLAYLVASLVEYPLRTPSLAAVAVIFLVLLQSTWEQQVDDEMRFGSKV